MTLAKSVMSNKLGNKTCSTYINVVVTIKLDGACNGALQAVKYVFVLCLRSYNLLRSIYTKCHEQTLKGKRRVALKVKGTVK